MAGVLAVASIAAAANREGQFSVSPVIGGITFNGPQHLLTKPVYGLRGGYNFTKALGVEALFDYANTGDTRTGANVDFFRYGGEVLYHFLPDNKLVPYVAAGLAAGNFKGKTAFSSSNKQKGIWDYGVGAKYFMTEDIALRGDVRHLMYSYSDRIKHTIEYTVGLYIPFGGTQPAAKPVEPAPAPAPAPAPVAPAPPVVVPPPAPAPPPPAAPTASLNVSPSSVTKGQSATLNWKSQNASGCDIQPGIGPVPPQGSRTITPSDSTSYDLSCFGAGGTATSAAGVTVVVPPPPAPVVSKAAERFCSKPAVINIQFETNKSDIKPQYDADLKNVSDFLKEFPKAKGEISGHTDNVASKAYNDKLSQSRAESVKKYIVEKYGISADRITAQGYGFSKPVASNKTKEGKAKNRRIEANFTCE
jgi:OOP family OmpA-OmpF porin